MNAKELKEYMHNNGIKVKEVAAYLNVDPKRISMAIYHGLNNLQERILKKAVDEIIEQRVANNQLF